MRLSIIAAVADNGVIGRDNALPWRLSADLRRFKVLTLGHHLLMGRKTFESIGSVLPGRTTVVISRGRPALPPGVLLAHSIDEAVAMARASGDFEAFVAGGAEIYELALPVADRLYLTRVHTITDGDIRFPSWS
jgi:dihydrofolate reductase